MATAADFRRPIQYKAKSDKFISWLQKQARKLKIELSRSFEALNVHENANLTTTQLKRHAEAIARTSSRKDPIPPHIIFLLEDVIRDRKEAARWHQGLAIQSAPETHASNMRHLHFITVLEDILSTLQGVMPAKELARKEANLIITESTCTVTAHENVFASLVVFQLPESNGESQRRHHPETNAGSGVKSKHGSEVDMKPDTRQVQDESLCSILNFFREFADLRLFVRNTWAEYGRRTISLQTATEVTRVAIYLTLDKTCEFFESSSERVSFDDIADFLHGYLHPEQMEQDAGTDPTSPPRTTTDKLSESDLFCYSTYQALRKFRIDFASQNAAGVLADSTGESWKDAAELPTHRNPVVATTKTDEYILDLLNHMAKAVTTIEDPERASINAT